jgi:uncharacterized membrane protein
VLSWVPPSDRISGEIDDHRTVKLPGNRYPIARAEFDQGAAESSHPMDRMILTLQPGPEEQRALESFTQAQHDPQSPLFHKWLTPKEFTERFGVSKGDLRRVTAWLTSHGFHIDETPEGGLSVIFSGTAAQVASAFHTEIRKYQAKNEVHYANAVDPEIPEALAGVVGGVVTLHDFRREPMRTEAKPAILKPAGAPRAPEYTGGSYHYLSPSDFATIYNTSPLYSGGIDGTGQTIAIVGRTNIDVSDVRNFRSRFGLPSNDPVVVLNGTDPGILCCGEETEALLDVEWSGAVAPKATVKFVVSASTNSTDGVDLSAQYIVSHNVAPVLSVSFGLCEAWLGSSEINFYNSLWQQAAAQGQTAFVSSGDSGAAGCDWGSSSTASYGRGVNGLCSSPYCVAVGGTQFNEGGNAAQYWSSTTNSSTGASAQSYIPEVAWNESGANGGSGLWATGGGVSLVFTKPTWQTGAGVPADGMRDVPDVALTAAGHDGYLLVESGSLWSVGGTSASSPSFAGLMALVNQNDAATGGTGRQGNANTNFYPLAANQAGGGASFFHTVTGGSNTVPGVTGFAAGPGYNQATGLGSVDANILVTHWTDANGPNFTVSTDDSTLQVVAGTSATENVTVNVSGGFADEVDLSVNGLPSGVSASFESDSFPSPGSGSSVLTLAAASDAAQGTFPIQIVGTSGSQTKVATLNLAVTGPTFSLTPGQSSTSIQAGGSGSVSLATVAGTGFNSDVSFTVTGAPAGVTAGFSASTISAPGTGTTQLQLAVANSVALGSYPLVITASGGGATKSITVTLQVTAPPSCTLISYAADITTSYPYRTSFQISCTNITGGFNTPMQLSATGALSGTSVTFSSATLAPGAVGTVFIQAAANATTGTSTLTVTASGGGVTSSFTRQLTVAPPPDFTLTPSSIAVTMQQGGTIAVTISSSHQGSFSAPVAFSIRGLPSYIAASFSSTTISAPGDGSTTLTFTSDPKNNATGSFAAYVTAVGSWITKTIPVTVTITKFTGFYLSTTSNALAIQQSTSASLKLTTVLTGGFNSAIQFSIPASGAGSLPSGVTATFSPQKLAAPGAGSTTVTFNVGASVTPGTYSYTVMGTGGNKTASVPLILVVNPKPTFALQVPSTASVTRGSTGTITVQTSSTSGFKSPVSLSVSGLPKGVTAAFTPSTISSGAGQSSLKFTSTSTSAAGSTRVTVTAIGGGVTQSSTVTITIR